MAQDGTWGDHVILHTAANCYKTRIRVISSLGCDVMISPNHPDVVNTNTLVVGHIHEKHYVSLRLKQGTGYKYFRQIIYTNTLVVGHIHEKPYVSLRLKQVTGYKYFRQIIYRCR